MVGLISNVDPDPLPEMRALKGCAKKEDGEIGSLEGLFICQSNL